MKKLLMIATVAGVMVACKNGEKKAETTDSTATSTPVAPTTEATPAPTTTAPAPTTEAAPATTAPAPTTEAAPADASKDKMSKDKMQSEAPATDKKMEATPKK